MWAIGGTKDSVRSYPICRDDSDPGDVVVVRGTACYLPFLSATLIGKVPIMDPNETHDSLYLFTPQCFVAVVQAGQAE